MNRIRNLAALAFVCVVLAACSTINLNAPKSFNAGLQDGYTTITAIAQTATTLKAAGKISDDDVTNIVTVLENMKSGLDIARQIHATDPQAGTDRLSAVIVSLTALQTYLATRSTT